MTERTSKTHAALRIADRQIDPVKRHARQVVDTEQDCAARLVVEAGVVLPGAETHVCNVAVVLGNVGNDGNGVPQFAATHYALGFYDVRSLTVGDLNSDSRPDYIIGSAYGGLYVHLNNGSGGFAITQVTTVQPNNGNPAVGPGAIADLNGDGRGDFVVTSGQANSTNVFLGNGNGTLRAPAILTPAASSVAVGDVNGDGRPDLIKGFDGSVSVYLNIGNGTFGIPISSSAGNLGWPSGLSATDVNGDGKLDVAASLGGAGKIAILPGNGDGTFGAPSLFGGIPNAVDVTLADFTGDGKNDIGSVSANGYGGQNYGVLTNTTPVALPLRTLTILGGVGNPGDIAANVEYFNPATGQWQSAFLADYNYPGGSASGHPWGTITGTTQWINYRTLGRSVPEAGPTTNQTLWYLYRVRFTVPADAVNPKMSFSLKADNFAQVAINGTLTGGTTRDINNANMPNVIEGQANLLNADAVFAQAVRKHHHAEHR